MRRNFVSILLGKQLPIIAFRSLSGAAATAMEKTSHRERTAKEPRQQSLHDVVIGRIDQVNEQIRLFRLNLGQETVRFRAGQWLDVHVPSLKAGGFTITSPPSAATHVPSLDARAQGQPYLELAVQKSPQNDVALWLWQPEAHILGAELQVRVGGSFVFPPYEWGRQGDDASGGSDDVLSPARKRERIVFVAGGVGVNPTMSMLGYLAEEISQRGRDDGCDYTVDVLYASKVPKEGPRHVLFLERIAGLFADEGTGLRGSLRLYATGGTPDVQEDTDRNDTERLLIGDGVVEVQHGRLAVEDLVKVVQGDVTRGQESASLVYICGPPTMTDQFVDALTRAGGVGIDPDSVKTEKWW